MAWELRNGKLYYYRKIRRGKRVFSEYMGTSETAELFFLLDEFDRIEKAETAMLENKQKDEIKKLNKGINQLAKIVNGMARASLLFSGYPSHKGQWRQRRNG